MVTITWKIANLERIVSNGFIIVAHWICNASENGYSTELYGSEIFEYDPNQADFIPYEQLTESIVVGWVHTRLGSNVAVIESTVTDSLDKLVNPVVLSGLPWASQIDTRSFTMPSPDTGE